LNIALIADPDMLLSEDGTNVGELVVRRLGRERAKHAYSWRSLVDAKAHISFGSSWPARTVNPLLSLYAAVVRPGLPAGNEGLRVQDALKAYTLGAAFATKEEHVKGSIREGKFADIVVLSKDPFKARTADLDKIQVDLTIAAGKVVYERPAVSSLAETTTPRTPASKAKAVHRRR
jgi:predicted amidohydrolase YtcJ